MIDANMIIEVDDQRMHDECHRNSDLMQGRRYLSAASAGFTLVELILVIVLMGILAAAALPRFFDAGTSARVASVRTLDAAIRSQASFTHMQCLVTASCGSTAGFYSLPMGGRTWLIVNAYPEAGDAIGGDQIDSMITYSGFSVDLPDNLTTRFALQGAPTPLGCSVSYIQAAALGSAPTITTTVTGC